MTIADLLALLGAVVALLLALAVIVTYIGRALAKTRFSRIGEALIRFGADLKGALESLRQPAGTPSVSAQPVGEAVAAIVQSPAGPTVAPPPPPKDPPANSGLNGPTMPSPPPDFDNGRILRSPLRSGFFRLTLALLLVVGLTGCTHVERAEVAADVEPYVEARKPLCKLVADNLGSPFVEYLCTAASAIPGVLRGMSTEDRLDASRSTTSGRIKVARENRETFERFFVQP